MRGTDKIAFRPYYPLIKYSSEKGRPYICRLAPAENGFSGEWINPDGGQCCLCFRARVADGLTEIKKITLTDSVFEVDGLNTGVDYEIWVESVNSENKSNIRLLKTDAPPEGTRVVNYLHPEDKQYIFSGKYLCSPSVTRLENGRLFASMDVFGSDMPQNLTLLFSSDDDGQSWHYVCDIFGFFWGLLFNRGNELYLLGMSTEYGDLKITKSIDNGENWSVPVTLFKGADRSCVLGGLHRAPMHFTEFKCRLYTSIEYGSWKSGGHLPGVLSVGKNCDFMKPENWEISDFLPFEGRWAEDCDGNKKDTIEGNLIVTPDGKLQNLLRWDKEKALVLNVTEEGPEYEEIRKMPVSDSMFRILEYKGRYLLISNRKPADFDDSLGSFRRNILSLFVSDDLKNWELVKDIIDFGDMDMMKFGFQYPSACIHENTLYVLIRSSYNGAVGYHDSNTILFTKLNLREI